MEYEQAVRQLTSPHHWCEGAEALVRLGDRRALVPLLEAYETPVEGGKRCLLEAMDKLGAREAAADLYASSPEQRWEALRLMELFGSDSHLSLLQQALSDADPRIRAQARDALVNQQRTPGWKRAMTEMLDSADPEIQRLAANALGR